MVSRDSLDETIQFLSKFDTLACDTETTGLRPWSNLHGNDRVFSVILAYRLNGKVESVYFNFNQTKDIPESQTLSKASALPKIRRLFSDPKRLWIFHNAKYDMHMLAMEGIIPSGDVWCTKAAARLEFNEHMKYSLSDCAARIGHSKITAVEDHIKENKLYDKVEIPGTSRTYKLMHYDKVPAKLIVPYGKRDAEITYHVYEFQRKRFKEMDSELPDKLPKIEGVAENERKLTKVVWGMEWTGVKIDRDFCERAMRHEKDRMGAAEVEFSEQSGGREFKNSAKLFSEVFEDEREKWIYTDKGNPSFESATLSTFEHPAAKTILEWRDAKSRANFYSASLWYADENDVVHPNFKPEATNTGRFGCSEPNLQNLTKETVEDGVEFLVRRAYVPRPNTFFFLPDYDQMEYRLMLEYACRMVGRRTSVVESILDGMDVHKAISEEVKRRTGRNIDRDTAKRVNFAYLYGAGDPKLAAQIGCSVDEAREIRATVSQSIPEMADFIQKAIYTAKTRGYLYNWFGRRYVFPDRNWAYKGPNKLCQGGGADIIKVAMVKLSERIKEKKLKSRMVLQIHDEVAFEIAKGEEDFCKEIVEIMEGVFPALYLPLTVGAEWSDKSLADKIKGFPV